MSRLAQIPLRHRLRLDFLSSTGRFRCATGYVRSRNGRPVLELRFDGVAGCLRTPTGGNSRQLIVIQKDEGLRTRFLTVREAARLMGIPDTFALPGSDYDGYRAMGDGVAVPVASHLAMHLLRILTERAR